MPDYHLEAEAAEEGYAIVCGVDEAGRGPLSGPVVAAACILPSGLYIDGLNDSKKLTPKHRERLYDEICENECPCGGDSTNDCEGCADSGDYHCVNGECVERPIGCPACQGNDKIYPGALKALGVPHTKHCPACGERLNEDV